MKIIHFDLFFKEEKELLVDLEMYLKTLQEMTISFDTMFGLRKIPRSDYYYQYVFTTAAYEKGQVRVLLLIEFH